MLFRSFLNRMPLPPVVYVESYAPPSGGAFCETCLKMAFCPMVGCLADWLAGWLAGWLVGSLVGWLGVWVGRLRKAYHNMEQLRRHSTNLMPPPGGTHS